uniref:ADNP zinc finger domain-containing protein n=1 Tax=Scophthalmus maximus TaxID=52904 RepID=A0A8D3ASF8_SCOMX
MYQLPVNNLTRIRRARKQVKKALEDIGLEYCKEAAEGFKEFCPNEQFVKGSLCLDICAWDPSYSKTQVNLIPVLQTDLTCSCTIHRTYLNAVVFFPLVATSASVLR